MLNRISRALAVALSHLVLAIGIFVGGSYGIAWTSFGISLWMAGPALAGPQVITPTPVQSVAGRLGSITLSAPDIAGLGTAATMNVTKDATGVASGADSRIVGAVQPGGPVDTNTVLGRTNAVRAAEVVDVLDSGVKCDGSTDNAPALATAMAKLTSGGTLRFPPASAKCLTSANLALPSNVTVLAEPGTVTLAPYPGSTANPLLLGTANSTNVLVYGVTLDGGGQDFTSQNNLATVYKASSVVFDHVAVQNTNGIPIVFSTGVSGSGVRSSSFTNIGNHWKTTGANADQKQAVVFCCGTTIATSAAQSGTGTSLTFASTAGIAVGNLASGTGIQPGSYVTAVTSTSVTLSLPTYAAVASGGSITFSSNFGNFDQDNTFNGTGLDAVSVANQVGFVTRGDRFFSVGGKFVNGGAAVYAANNDKLTVATETVLGAFGNGIDIYRSSNVLITGNNVDKAGGSGISFAAGTGASIVGNVSNNSNQGNGSSSLQSGISISNGSTDTSVAYVTVAGNTATDTQATKTQPYGLQVTNGSTPVAGTIWIDQNNQFNGNATSALGQLATAYSAPSASLGYVTQTGSGSNTGVAMIPAGTGGVQVGPHDSTSANGNPIGTYAVDLQTSHQSTAHTASGDHSGIFFGSNDTASGQFSAAAGTWDVAQGPYSWAIGAFATDRYRNGSQCWANGAQTGGVAQTCKTVLRGVTSSTTAKVLTSDGNAAGSQNLFNIAYNNFSTNVTAVFQIGIRVVAIDRTNPGNFFGYYEPIGTLVRTTTASTTSYTPSGTATTKTIGTAGTIALAADTTNAGLTITWTAPNADTWAVAAYLDAAEVN